MNAIEQGFTPECLLDDLNALEYIIKSKIDNRVNTIDIVRVIAVGEDNTVDVIPIIRNTTPSNEPVDETPIYGLRYIRWQYGLNGIKAKPSVGDIGLILICKKDTSSIEAGIVGNNSKFNTANGIYLGGLNGLNQEPTQFIEFKDDGIEITSTGTININATTANVTATEINLGGEGAVGVAKIGSRVTNNGQPSGTTVGFIAEGSTITKTL